MKAHFTLGLVAFLTIVATSAVRTSPTIAALANPGTMLWAYEAGGPSRILQYDLGTGTNVSSCIPSPSGNGRGIAMDPVDGNLWYTFVAGNFNGDGLIHKTSVSCSSVGSLNFGGSAGAPQPDIGALDIDPDDANIWAAGYQPVGGQSFLYKINRSTGAVIQSCSVPFGGGGVGNDSLAVAKLSGLPGSGKYLLTDGGEIDTSNGLVAIDSAACVGGQSVSAVTSYPKAVGMTGIAFGGGQLVATDLASIYALGGAPFSTINGTMSASPSNLLEDITLQGAKKPLRYVALGDSVPYGHGLANPGTGTQSGLGPNQGPSAGAYPSLVASDLGFELKVRSTGCQLEKDQLAVSGAPSSGQNVTGKDTDCPDATHAFGRFPYSTKPHKAVNPEELAAANLAADQPGLVTIQVGADDINFADCLEAELGNVFTSTLCVMPTSNGGRSVTKKVRDHLNILESQLDSILGTIESRAPNARVAVLNYYQIILPPGANGVDDGSALCGLIGRMKPAFRAAAYRDAVLLQTELNKSIASAASKHAKVMLVDLTHVFDGKEMCTPNSEVFSGPVWRAAHPTAAGQRDIALAVEAALGP